MTKHHRDLARFNASEGLDRKPASTDTPPTLGDSLKGAVAQIALVRVYPFLSEQMVPRPRSIRRLMRSFRPRSWEDPF